MAKRIEKPGAAKKKRKDLKIYVSTEIASRLKIYAGRIGGSVTSIILGWIMEKLPEAEANLDEKKEA